MILYINVFLTEEKFNTQGRVVRQNAKYSNKLEIFKYMLSSLQHFYPWTKVIINVELDSMFLEEKSNLHKYIEELFHHCPLVLKDKRNVYQEEWKADYELLDDDMILFSCNHDHIFIDPDPSYYASLIEKYRNYDGYLGIQFSHWPEMCCNAFYHVNVTTDLKFDDDHFSFNQKMCHAIQVINKKTYYHWWVENDLQGIAFPRSDGIGGQALEWFDWYQPQKIVIAYRENARHFDGYQHTTWENLPNQKVPVLEIPDNFFENKLKINYSNKYLDGYTNINPLEDRLKIFDPNGSDLNIPKQIIPHFWKDKIVEFKDEYKYLSSVFSNDEIYDEFLRRILNIWSETRNNQCENGNFMRKKVIEWYNKLR